MSQDSEQNDRNTGPGRDGDSNRQSGRSFGRRDDVRNGGTSSPRPSRDSDRPRFSRDSDRNDRPKFNRPADGDRPRFNRDDRTDGPRNVGPRTDGPRNDRPRTDGPRSTGPRTDGPRTNDRNSDQSGKPRFDRNSNDRPSFNRNSERPRFSRDNDRSSSNRDSERPRRDNDRDDRPKFNRPADGDRPRFNRDDRTYRPAGAGPRPDSPARPNRDDRPERPRRDTDSPRFPSDRSRSNDRSDSDRPKRDERPSFSRDSERPRFNRTDAPRDANRESKTDGPARFPRERKSTGGFPRPEKPAFKRVGGFSREADERNNFGGEDRPGNNRRNDRTEETGFTGRQRKESGDRRTGSFTKAPDYNLEQIRANQSDKRGRPDDRRRSQDADPEKGKRAPANDGTTRLNRFIANSGVCSRREADELIAHGDISVNGKVVTEMGYKVKEGDTVKYGTKVLNPERFVYVLLNKPKDYITTTEDPEERKTVMELVADAGKFRMYPVGRLDRNTTGLLLITNDGELADKLTHPSNNIRKIYQVELDKPITEEHFEAIKKGIELEDGPVKPDAVSIVTPDGYVIGIEIHSGRNRIVRRIFESFGYEVTKLDRTTYAGLTKKELPRGKWRFLDPKEVVKLKYLNS
ncbi:pseudouridine synthase [Spirosoma fluviale]|uniref:Pseudouridine synthase n=1 Tax=Spirosoma fluviale TaxID=1597977 RepID=A0A286G9W4_9BACT|nr:pseudouridine synthase [Spirosoma fluviale]SOD91919.1 23S rRNA pseudouridine2605 synthase [Spirosoma fluviale]